MPDPKPVMTDEQQNSTRLNLLRVRAVVAERKSLHRTVQWCWAGVVSMWVLAGAAGVKCIELIRADRFGLLLAALLLVMVAASIATRWFARHAIEARSRLNTSRLPEPAEPAMFETLGSRDRRASDLENIS